MGIESLLVVALLGLLVAAALARRLFAPGWQRNALSVTMVVLGLFTAFMVFYGAGSLVRSAQPQVQRHGAVINVGSHHVG